MTEVAAGLLNAEAALFRARVDELRRNAAHMDEIRVVERVATDIEEILSDDKQLADVCPARVVDRLTAMCVEVRADGEDLSVEMQAALAKADDANRPVPDAGQFTIRLGAKNEQQHR
jgi:hypothetical protein